MRRTLLLLLVLAVAGGWLLAGASQRLRREQITSEGVPLTEVHPAGGGKHPGVVVAHGFSGSAKLMAPFGDTLAARGYVVVLLDFTGHGANTVPLPDQVAGTDASTEALQRDLRVAVAHLRSLPDVDASAIALVGHSMGAGAVTRYAAAHPDVTATVAISLPSAVVASPERPARLMTMAGALEFPDFRAVATSVAAERADREVRIVPGVEHISILYAPETHRETAAWLDRAFNRPRDDDAIPFPGRRLFGAGLLALAFLIGFYPVVAVLAGRDRRLPEATVGAGGRHPGPTVGSDVRQSEPTVGSGARQSDPTVGSDVRQSEPTVGSGARQSDPTVGSGARQSDPTVGPRVRQSNPTVGSGGSGGAGGAGGAGGGEVTARGRFVGIVWLVMVAGVAAGVAAVVGRLLPTTRLPLAVAGYVAAYAVVTGGLLLLCAGRLTPYREGKTVSGSRLLLALPYAIVAIALPVHLGMTWAWPTGDRWWLLVVIWGAFGVLAYASERVSGGDPLRLLAVTGVFLVVLTAAAVTGLTHGFVLLALIPLIGLMLWQALWSAVLNRFAAPSWVIALIGAVVVAWPLTVTLPTVGG